MQSYGPEVVASVCTYHTLSDYATDYDEGVFNKGYNCECRQISDRRPAQLLSRHHKMCRQISDRRCQGHKAD